MSVIEMSISMNIREAQLFQIKKKYVSCCRKKQGKKPPNGFMFFFSPYRKPEQR